MEVVCLDSYDIFMIGNVFGLCFTRNYISTSNYLEKISDFEFEEDQKQIIDALYYRRI